ncbi:MAG: cupin domain-containing protein, partial [Mycobacteriales bacterium]
SWEECSTTHVHDDDRLLVIETGEMEFWNCFGVKHTYRPGDMTFIPKHRLHGSVVQSGECVYHQPVITRELLARHG